MIFMSQITNINIATAEPPTEEFLSKYGFMA
jgi:hypothetical protein